MRKIEILKETIAIDTNEIQALATLGNIKCAGIDCHECPLNVGDDDINCIPHSCIYALNKLQKFNTEIM